MKPQLRITSYEEHLTLVYVAMFLTKDPTLIKRLRQKAEDGTKIRLLLGDPASQEISRCSLEEGIGKGTIAAKVRNALAFYRPHDSVPGIEIRCHGTTLYNSIYRFDEEMLVNTHVYGSWPLTPRCCTCVGSPAVTCSRPTRKASRTSGTPPHRRSGRPVARRVDYYHDPDAPRANSIVVAVTAFILDATGRLLMIRRTDNDLYAIPGGAQEVGETISQTIVREVREETGITVEVIGLIGIYSDPAHLIAFTDGEVRQEFSICFRAQPAGGELRTSNESKDVLWVEPTRLDDLNIHSSTRLRIQHGYEYRPQPFYG